MKHTMEFNRIGGEFTKTWVKRHSEFIREYKGYSIVFGPYQKTENGTFWHISIYRVENEMMELEYRSKKLWACDSDAWYIEMCLAKEFIDSLKKAT